MRTQLETPLTTQIPDKCWYQDCRWEIDEFEGNDEIVIPTSETLGFGTITNSTANWSGRIDHFIVYNDKLFLFKVEVNLPPEIANIIPLKARRETVVRSEWMDTSISPAPRHRSILHDTPIVYFIYDDLFIFFTGTMHLSNPGMDPWDYPQSVFEWDKREKEKMSLSFEEGKLIRVSTEG